MENFPGNSHGMGDPKKPAAEKPAIEAVVTTEAVKRKTPLGKRLKNLFFGGDAKGVVRYVVGDVLIPAAKKMFVDSVEQGANRMVYGNSAPSRSPIFGQPRFSYNRPVDRGGSMRSSTMLPGQPPQYSRQSRQEIGELILGSREDAEIVLERMRDIIDKFEVASVSDLNSLAGMPSNYTDNSWGWSNLSRVEIHQIRDGYLLRLPPVEQI